MKPRKEEDEKEEEEKKGARQREDNNARERESFTLQLAKDVFECTDPSVDGKLIIHVCKGIKVKESQLL